MKQIAPALVLLVLAARTVVITRQEPGSTPEAAFSVFEASIPEMQEAMKRGRVTSRDIVQQYLTRIALYEDKLNAAITINPDALKEADERDRERAQGRVRGSLHGIPIALKDNIHTTALPTTGGALAFDGFVPPYEATLARNLREAGAIIIAKTGLTELANWVASDDAGQLQRAEGLRHEPLRSAARSARDDVRRASSAGDGRVEFGDRHGSKLLGRQCRHRNIWIDSQSLEPEHARRDEADRRSRQPLWRDSNYRRSGHARSDGEVGQRRGHHARRAWRVRAPDPDDPATTHLRAAAGARLHAFLGPTG